mmetsp:Transcript_65886/g.137572  ORF Transcript_65886/g.137572 Transcript_65886/m.137572 type:complete len:288 (-) Transcript_65886:355-1218(-)|eukprot:CAMPEP_0206425836 /NCGR_PEP_ID=MMETSP0324_2-20121206/4025_1 /ASSEMBLY_ACC=CAM_ASM_000836 /TAXON_ID=2866 /ORGANISM="Crypthecodinium cohnii, Strain Seligo" /LENGTH=287 /DNA_ID=CAMNT_0053890687 /DNA_START=140 /DNA_END=1003 /DNA_ORIENTATION=-
MEKDWRPFAAGWTAGILNITVGHPLDTLKVRVQTGRALYTGGLRGLFAGIQGPLLTIPCIGSLNFGLYDTFRHRLMAESPRLFTTGGSSSSSSSAGSSTGSTSNMLCVFLSSVAGGSLVAFITAPMTNVKVQQQTLKASASLTMAEAARRVGPRGLYKAFGPHLLVEGFGRGVYMVGFEGSKKLLGVDEGSRQNDPFDLPKRVLCGSCGGASAWFAVYPADTIRNRLMRDWERKLYASTMDCLKQSLKLHGIPGLYQGLMYSLVRAIPAAGVTLTTYDLMMNALKRE